MDWLTERETLPHASVAVQVRMVIYVPAQVPVTVASEKVMTGAASQASVAIGAVKVGVAGQLIVAFAPCPDNTGAVTS